VLLSALLWQDHAVIVTYLACMIALGFWLSRKQKTDQDYFLGGRRMPWFAVGMSVIASLLSSITYMSEPGEVWNSGLTHMTGKMLAIPVEIGIVWGFCIPFMMRFRFTSAYEYLEHRFGYGARLLGVAMFVTQVVLWMGVVVLVSSLALAKVSGMPLWAVIATVGVVATLYTTLGGLRAVIWTDVVQVSLLIGGGLFVIGFVIWTTGTWLPEWLSASTRHLQQTGHDHALPVFSFDPRVRATLVTVAVNMCIWHVCTHTGNQMTVQRYFSTSDVRAARRSFMTGSMFGIGLNLMLSVVGLALLYFYFGQGRPLDGGLDASSQKDRDLIFSTFSVYQLPPGCGGAILAALLAAAMSSIDSGVNSIATVLTVEQHRRNPKGNHVASARWITLAAGLFITCAAYALNFVPGDFGIVSFLPRTFNAVTAPLGGLFLVAMFLPRAGGVAACTGAICGLATSLVVGYFQEIVALCLRFDVMNVEQVEQWGLLDADGKVTPLSFTWIMPSALLMTFCVALLVSLIERPPRQKLAGLTWWTRHEKSPLTSTGSEP
jgi:SSS family solute:Na+ symporter